MAKSRRAGTMLSDGQAPDSCNSMPASRRVGTWACHPPSFAFAWSHLAANSRRLLQTPTPATMDAEQLPAQGCGVSAPSSRSMTCSYFFQSCGSAKASLATSRFSEAADRSGKLAVVTS